MGGKEGRKVGGVALGGGGGGGEEGGRKRRSSFGRGRRRNLEGKRYDFKVKKTE